MLHVLHDRVTIGRASDTCDMGPATVFMMDAKVTTIIATRLVWLKCLTLMQSALQA